MKTRLSDFDLAVILYTSPLPPSATLKRLKDIFLVDPGDELVSIARQDELLGHREGLRRLIELKLNELAVWVENTEVILQQISDLLMTFNVALPLLVVGILLLLNPIQGSISLWIFSVFGLIAGAFAYRQFPGNIRFPNPPLTNLVPLSLIPLLTYLLSSHELLFIALTLASLPSAIITYRKTRNIFNELKENDKLLTDALRCPFHLYRCIKPDLLHVQEVNISISNTIRSVLELYGKLGVDKQGLRWLTEYYRQFFKLVTNIRSKTLIVLFNSIVGMLVLSVGLSLITSVFTGLRSMHTLTLGLALNINSQTLESIRPLLNITLIADSISYSVAISSVREGNPLYFPLYLPAMFLATFAGLVLGPLIISLG